MNDALRDLAARNGDFLDARYGTAAYRTQLDIRNTRILLRATTSEMMEAAKGAATGDPAAIADWVTKQQRAAMVFSHLSTLSADWAHAGHELNRVMEGWDQTRDLAQQILDTTGMTPEQLQRQARLMMQLPTPETAGKFARDMQLTRGQRIRNAVVSYFINNLISGPLAHGVQRRQRRVRSLPGRPRNHDAGCCRLGARRRLRRAGERSGVFRRGRGAALRHGSRRARRNRAGDQGAAMGVPLLPDAQGELALAALNMRPQAIPGRIGYVLETPSRVVASIHSLFYSMAYSQEIARQAWRDTAARGLAGDDFDAEVARLTSSPTPA